MSHEEEAIDSQLRKPSTGGGGGKISFSDPRVSRGLTLFWGTIASLLVLVLGFCANNLYQLNLTMRDVLKDNQVTVSTLSDHELRLRSLEREVSTFEGRNLRGFPDQKSGPRGH